MTTEYRSPAALREETEAVHDARAPRKARVGRSALLTVIAVLAFGGLFWLGYLPKLKQRAWLRSQAASSAARVSEVKLVRPLPADKARLVTLPGSIQGLEETVVYARADGYLAKLKVDMGDRVTHGQLLAELDNPEVDREIQQARANLASSAAAVSRARAAHEHSATTLKRYRALVPGLVSSEEIDQKQTQAALDEADVSVAEAARTAQLANLDRLRQLKAFTSVLAPFSGTISARMVERGALVSRGKDSPLFRITSLETVRVFVQVPQS